MLEIPIQDIFILVWGIFAIIIQGNVIVTANH